MVYSLDTESVMRHPLAAKSVELLQRIVKERTGSMLPVGRRDRGVVRLAVDRAVQADGFCIADAGDGVRVAGGDERGLLYGVGKLLREGVLGEGGFVPGPWRGRSVPRRAMRGMYFATHYHNFYEDAPLEAVCRYVEELALWGCNVLNVWFDMFHFGGFDDPAAQRMIARLRAILRAANGVGMGASLLVLANEAYKNSPEGLRADWTAGHDGYHHPPYAHYQREICPSRPGGMEYILRTRRQMFEAFADVDVRNVFIWPYDQGGCTCSACAPWGANGFLRVAEPMAELAREFWPATKIVLSTWYFDHFVDGEWEGLGRAFAHKPDWVDYLLADDWGGFPEYPLKHGVPGGLPVVGFPEISMERMYPWGSYGANPRPRHWQEQADRTRGLLDGSFPYSEGIFEDVNKVFCLQNNWDPDRPIEEVLREYAVWEFGREAADVVVQACYAMEEDMGHNLSSPLRQWMQKINEGQDAGAVPEVLYEIRAVEDPGRALRLLESVQDSLRPGARRSWRWRMLWLRAALDAELRGSGGRATRQSETNVTELAELSFARNAGYAVVPVGLEHLRRLRDGA